VDVRSEAVRRTGACNTFWGDHGGRLHGDNTDVEGFRRALRSFLGGSVTGIRVLLLGAGGAARATLVGLLDEGASEVVLFNRTAERARAVARRIGGQRARVVSGLREIEGEDYDLVVNATRVGLDPSDPSPVDFAMLNRAGAAMDLVYGRGSTPFVRAAERLGIRATDGLDMLVQQGAAAFERWWGQPAPLEAMRAAVQRRTAA
jgi:shikimate dehydrogenase